MAQRDVIDLRSDVKTLPTQAMFEAMVSAELGDSKAGEDPTVLRLERMAAERVGMEAGLLLISGAMANLAAMMTHAAPGEACYLDRDAHIYYYEGAHAGMAGLQTLLTPARDGFMAPEDLAETIRYYRRQGGLLCLENTHNRAGGRVIPVALFGELCEVAHKNGLKVHVDGARIFNAAVAAGVDASEYGRRADSLMFCLSKSLGCPLGSVLCGRREFIDRALRARGRLGGGMRQAGVIAAAGIVALERGIDRLAKDHALARRLAQAVADMPGLRVDVRNVETNMVNVGFDEARLSMKDYLSLFEKHGVLVGGHPPDKLRLVTHHHHTPEIIEDAIQRMRAALAGCGGGRGERHE